MEQENFNPEDQEQPVETTEQQPVEQPSSIEEQIQNLSEEDMDKFDTFEDFMAQQNQESQITEPNQEQVQQGTTQDIGSEFQETTLTDTEFRKLVTSNFKANHQEFTIEDPDEIRKLMQYGLNYHKKMTELAPHRKALKTLEKHGLLQADKLNYAIELLEGNKGAIAKLLQEHSVDTYELPNLEDEPYQTGNYLLSDERITFDEKVSEMRESDSGSKVVNYIQDLDSESFYEVYTNPDMMNWLQSHIESGLFADASAFLEKERALGKVPSNIKDIDAYAYVAQHLEKENPSKYSSKPQPKVLGNNLNQQQPVAHNQAKFNAGIPNNTAVAQQQQSYSGLDSLLNATDEELAKYDNWEQYLASNNLNFQR